MSKVLCLGQGILGLTPFHSISKQRQYFLEKIATMAILPSGRISCQHQ